MSNLTDRRVRVMHEIVTGMWTIKVNCWEKPYTSLVNTLRRYVHFVLVISSSQSNAEHYIDTCIP